MSTCAPERAVLMSTESSFVDLICRVRAGDEAAASELVRRYEPSIRRVVRVHLRDSRLRRVLDSTDICQSVLATFFVRANMGQFELESPDHLLKLLATIARNKVINEATRHQADRRDYRRSEALGERDIQMSQADPGKRVEMQELLQKVREGLSNDERLLAEQRSRGESWAEIALAHDAGAEGLRKKLSRGLDRVLKQLGLDDRTDE
jgi:RNA polymerase sigma factor (sigma-70 family)